eukprot:scaffold186694_cov32-Prasinocladus_malaysianus.AAC.1
MIPCLETREVPIRQAQLRQRGLRLADGLACDSTPSLNCTRQNEPIEPHRSRKGGVEQYMPLVGKGRLGMKRLLSQLKCW